MSRAPAPTLDNGDYAATLRDIGRELGISAEATRQIERRALAKCRAWCEENGFQLHDLLPEEGHQ